MRIVALGLTVLAILLAPFGVSVPLAAQSAQSPEDAAESAYRNGQYRAAYDQFRALARTIVAAKRSDALPPVDYDSGLSLYRLAQYEKAIPMFRSALSGSVALQERCYYNLGNSYMRLAGIAADRRGSLRAAVNSYEAALLLDARDSDARWNLEIALRQLSAQDVRAGNRGLHKAAWASGNLTKSGYAGTPETGAGAAPGGGLGANQSEHTEEQITEITARQLLKAEQGAATPTEVSHLRPVTRRLVHANDW